MNKFWLIWIVFLAFSAEAQQTNRADSAWIKAADSTEFTPLFVQSSDTVKAPAVLTPAPEIKLRKHIPQKATKLSAILPGLGQIYNREPWWRIGLVYAAVGIPAYFFIDNNTWYHKTKKAYEIKLAQDTARFGEIDNVLLPLDTRSLQFYRNEFRKNRDYSALFFLLAWGLNVVDATVYAHLKEFDVSDELSFKVKPTYDPFTGTMSAALTFSLKQPPKHPRNFAFLQP